ncbi:hypothetical protein RIR_e63292_A0A2N0NIV9_9GLOM [Rhizophagus irregularis DAOM 181602=DAOM 197198]|nr:hypothetical protein RIR_e63292_A0A2N0NIV9_9GLOM [Rhizophagus irregularis DAOM 181602=DAOM 197198]CAG8676299.1 5396_t:CDS:2 [Rhizophagus irregularis]
MDGNDLSNDSNTTRRFERNNDGDANVETESQENIQVLVNYTSFHAKIDQINSTFLLILMTLME